MLFVPYIMFDGNAEEALEFYGKALGSAEPPYIMRYSDAQGMDLPDGYESKIMHAQLTFPGGTIYISDSFPGTEVSYNDSISFNIGPDSEEQLESLFAALLEGGKVIQPIEPMFWGSKFGSLNDKFGIHWSFDYQLPEGKMAES